MKSLSPTQTPTPGTRALRTRFFDSNALLEQGDFDGLRRRGEDEGYLYFKGLLPADAIRQVRRDMLAVVEAYGWRAPGQDGLGGTLDLDALNRIPDEEMRSDIGVSRSAYHDVQRLESFHALPHHPNLLALYAGLFRDEVLVHPRHIARMITAHRVMIPTPQHQDFPLIQGSSNTWTCWFPLGDCPRAMGSLTVLRASHKEGYIPIRRARGAGSIAVQLCRGAKVWVEGDFAEGDVLTFPCFTVHRALRSKQPEQIRLSLDVRYQPASEAVEQKSLLPHCELTWEEIYANWESDNLTYYWDASAPKLSPWDDTLLQPARRIC